MLRICTNTTGHDDFLLADNAPGDFFHNSNFGWNKGQSTIAVSSDIYQGSVPFWSKRVQMLLLYPFALTKGTKAGYILFIASVTTCSFLLMLLSWKRSVVLGIRYSLLFLIVGVIALGEFTLFLLLLLLARAVHSQQSAWIRDNCRLMWNTKRKCWEKPFTEKRRLFCSVSMPLFAGWNAWPSHICQMFVLPCTH